MSKRVYFNQIRQALQEGYYPGYENPVDIIHSEFPYIIYLKNPVDSTSINRYNFRQKFVLLNRDYTSLVNGGEGWKTWKAGGYFKNFDDALLFRLICSHSTHSLKILK